ncbi:hypothetical protein T4B_6424 [Trichinella pseudospiralis]|uniref:Integrator complex subunit 5 C-terminal domain-containing protein n=1 Tax=Trichinella pseudospiralis TaxID=6337 RepID=A0A0V0XJE0_TRIPS|nr:hypothetical protein T4E_4279 [Trichinella pseudospiralis]KRY65689.1 hypothetical protein T4A_12100 [Trichinella pseudospiralis]KRZ15082.1 hypothetical protein T4B_6424 [Trichinella pseudospiralis]
MNSRGELRIIRRFLFVANTMPNIHGYTSRWATVSVKDMVQPTVYLMEHLVSYRLAVLDFLSSLLHENMLFDIFQIDCLHFAVHYTRGRTVESIGKLICSLDRVIVKKSKRGAAEIFKWALKLSMEMSLRNYRRICMILRTKKKSKVIKFFLNCTAGKWIVRLLCSCLHELLPVDTKKYMSMLYDTGMSRGQCCIWILCGTGIRFPLALFNHIFKADVENFWYMVKEYKRRFSSHSSKKRRVQFCSDRLPFIMRNTRIYGIIIKSSNAEVACKMVRYFSRGMWSEGNKPAREFPFLFRLCVSSSRITNFLVSQFFHGNRRILPQQLLRAEKCLSYVPRIVLYGRSSRMNVFCRMIMSFKNHHRRAVLTSLWEYAFTKNRKDDSSMRLFRKICFYLAHKILLHNCRYNNARRYRRMFRSVILYKRVPRYTLLDKAISNPMTVVLGMVSRKSSQRKFFLQSAVGVSYVKGPVAMSEYLNYILFTATHDYQLKGFFKLCKMVPKNAKEAIRILMTTRSSLIETKFQFLSCRISAKVMCRRWAANMRKVLKVDKKLARCRRSTVPRIGKTILANYVQFALNLISMALQDYGKWAMDILLLLGRPPILNAVEIFEIIRKLCETVCTLLTRHFAKSAIMESYDKLCRYFSMFVRSQYFYTRIVAIALLIRTAKPEEDRFALGEKELNAEIAKSTSMLNIRGQLLKYYYKGNPSMLDRKSFMPSSDARCAVGCSKPLTWNAQQSFKLCRLFDRLCIESTRKNVGIKYSLIACRQLAKNLSVCWRGERFPISNRFPTRYEYVCLDIEIYVAYKKELQKYPFLFDLLMIVSEAYPCLWYCFSILKGLFYMCLAEVEGCLSKKSRLEDSLLMRLQLIMHLFMKGKMLPPPLCYVMGLQKELELSHFFNILVNVWDYLATVLPTSTQIDQLFEQELKNPGSTVPFRGNMKGALEFLEYVCIFNMEDLGPLYAKFIDTS